MTTTQTHSPTQAKKSTKKRQQSFPCMDIGSPKVPVRQIKKTPQQYELLSDWDHAS
jgi:hypothetical protein